MRGFAAAAAVGLAVAVSSCAIVGYDLHGYGPAGQGGAGGGTSSASHMQATGGADGCSPDDACFERVAGFDGPFAFFSGKPGVACAAPWGKLATKGGTAADEVPLVCEACACGDEPCAPSVFDFYSGTCATLIATSAVATANGCQPLVGPISGINTATARVVPTSAGTTCTPSGGAEVAHPAAKFTDEALLCSPSQSGGACGQDGKCYPNPSSPFETTVCVSAPGDVACPSGYPNAFKLFDKLDDQRKCSACQCGAPGVACSTTDVFEPNASCTGGTFVFSGDGVCHSIAAASTVAAILMKVDSPCTPSGGQPTGDVAATKRSTVCCR